MEQSNKDKIGHSNRLNETLLDAIAQSRALVSKLDEQARTIATLRRENDELKREIEALKDSKPNIITQLDLLFQQNVAKQAEIESLKADLRAANGRDPSSTSLKHGLVRPFSAASSGSVLESTRSSIPDQNKPITVAVNPFHSSGASHGQGASSVTSSVPKRKRDEGEGGKDNGSVRTTTGNALGTKRSWRGRKDRSRSSPDVEAILSVTEDGQDDMCEKNQNSSILPSKRIPAGLHSRLDALLSAADSPSRAPLSRPSGATNPSDLQPEQGETPHLNKTIPDNATVKKQNQFSNLRFLRPVRASGATTKDKDGRPIRERSIDQLNLSHFKLNPEYTGYGAEAATNCLPDCKRPECSCGGRAMRAIAMSLAPDNQLSDDDLLLDLLGPGSEQKVATLTSLARENLLHEVRVKRAANEYGKKSHRRISREHRAASPTGFWATEIPDEDESRRTGEEVRRWQKSEIERRYHEAQTGHGKWIFADEIYQ